MNSKLRYCIIPIAAAFGVLGLGSRLAMQAKSDVAKSARMGGIESLQTKIARALSAGPSDITPNATVAERDSQGELKILRPGTNNFTCMPGDPSGIGMPAMCEDKASMQWDDDFAHHRPKPTNTVPGITYMLVGATQRSDSDPYDRTSPPMRIGPHWMIMWPFDAKTTGLPTTHRPTGAYIMWAGSPYAHLHVMGRPSGNTPQ